MFKRAKIPKLVYWASGIATLGGVSVLVKDYLGGPNFQEDVSLQGKTAIVTGANTGLGYQVALGLAERGAKVYLACRDRLKCETAREDIVLNTGNKHVYCRYCDLSSQDSIKKFARRFHKDEQNLDILVNNAGIMWTPHNLTVDGIESQLGVNHMGHFLLTNLLIDVLKKSSPSRIVTVASTAHFRGTINVSDLNSDQNYSKSGAYSQSKLANVLFTRELAKRLEGTGVTANAVHPGLVDTEIIRSTSWLTRALMFVVRPIIWPFIKSPRQGAQSVLHVALHPELQYTSGQYFDLREIKEPSPEAQNDQLALWLWLVSEKWTKLSNAQKELNVPTLSTSEVASSAVPEMKRPINNNIRKGVPETRSSVTSNAQPS